ncbi:FkbM family methyltransferase [Methylobacterium sp. P1-11]|nr:FkbM family methyltransferase [Methylobacterium sp. P1-11]
MTIQGPAILRSPKVGGPMLKKQLMPSAVSLFSLPGLTSFPRILENIGTALQSKRGGGFDADWQEVENAVSFISSDQPIIFDIGGNVGNWSRRIFERLTTMGSSAKIFIFEPQPQCWPAINSMKLENCELIRQAVGDTEGAMDLYQGENSEVASAYNRSDFSGITDIIKVDVTTIDAFRARNKIDFIDYIKMDIEGHELKAVLGAIDSLKTGKIGAISFEFGPANVNSRTFFIDFFVFFNNLGMDLYRMGHDGVPILITTYDRGAEYFSGVANYIASFSRPAKWREA